MLFLLCSGIIKADCRACYREQRVSPDGGGTGPMLSGVHHPTDVALQGRVGAVPGLPLPRRLKGHGEKSTRLVAELFMLNPTGSGPLKHNSNVSPWHRRADFPSRLGRSEASSSGPSGEACEACGASGHCGSWASQAR